MAYIGRMPITSAATSMSRIAIHARPMCAAHQVLRQQREHHQEGQAEQVLLAPAMSIAQPNTLDGLATETEPDDDVVGEPADAQERPVAEELRRQRGHRQVEALDAQARDAEHDADQRGADAAEQQARRSAACPSMRTYEVVGRVGADRHEGAGARARSGRSSRPGCSARAPPATGSGTGSGWRGTGTRRRAAARRRRRTASSSADADAVLRGSGRSAGRRA